MIRGAKAAVLALLLLAPVAHARGAFIPADDYQLLGANARQSIEQQNLIVQSFLTQYGQEFDVIPSGVASVAAMTAATFTVGGVTTTYDWMVVGGFNNNQITGRKRIALNPTLIARVDSLMKFNRWPSVPTLFLVSPSTTASFAATGNGCGGCTTGVTGPTAAYSTSRSLSHATYAVGGTEEWRNTGDTPQGFPLHAATGSGIHRKILVNQNSNSGCAGCVNTCTDCDAPTAGRPAATDSVVLWARYRSAGDPDPMFFAHYTIANASQWDWGIVGCAFAALDSATGGQVLDPDKLPIRMGLYIEGGFSRSRYNLTGQDYMLAGGTFCRSDSCDTSFVKAAIDSIKALATRTGVVRVTLGVEVDSVEAYASEKAWWSRLDPYIRYSPRIHTGVGASAAQTGSGATSSSAPRDVFGYARARTILPPGATGLPDPCDGADDTSSVYCNAKWMLSLALQKFPGKVSRILFPPMRGDWSPTTMTRASAGPGLDSLFWAFKHAGIDGFVTDLDHEFVNIGSSGSIASNGSWLANTTSGTNPAGYGIFDRSQPVYVDPGTRGETMGRMKFLASRGAPRLTAPEFYQGHDFAAESGEGVVARQWFGAPLPLYVHWFYHRTPVMIVTAGWLGRAGNSGYTAQHSWWQIKWAANRMAAMNRLAGREVMRFDWLDDLP
jgi:hypothetical protein